MLIEFLCVDYVKSRGAWFGIPLSIQGVSCLWENSIYGIQGASCLWESSINSMFCSIYKDPNLGWHPGPCSGIQSMVMHWLNKVENAKKKKKIGFEIRT